MNNTFIYLKTCDTCRKILAAINLPSYYTLREIKTTPLNTSEIEFLGKLQGSYVDLINKRAQKFQTEPYSSIVLNEKTAKKLLAEDYTFLKRPILVTEGKMVAGNGKSEVELMKKYAR
ncbi:MAG: arsenate reductase family protein [Flavobacteriales bacterium]